MTPLPYYMGGDLLRIAKAEEILDVSPQCIPSAI